MKEYLNKLIEYDNELKSLNEKINKIKRSKVETEEYIKQTIEQQQLQNKIFIINNKKIKYNESKTYQSFSLKYLEEQLSELIEDRESITHIMNHLKTNRKMIINKEIKILDYNNE
jgi:hypothetical protein